MATKEYPHLSDTKFPDLPTVNVYKYKNDLDYDIYEAKTKIKLMNVSWCGDYENVVYFETKDKRDEWLDKQDGITRELSTMFRLYANGDIKVDIPIDECMNYNYLVIDYEQAPLQAVNSGYQRMCYFISDMKQDSINTTRLYLSIDYWTSYIYDMGISYVNLLRGHAPMIESKIKDYLNNPIENSEYLLTPDVNYGSMQRVVYTQEDVFNDDEVLLGFLTNASMEMNWSYEESYIEDDETVIVEHKITPTAAWESSQAFSSVDIFVLDDALTSPERWQSFREAIVLQCPQFLQTVKGMFIIPKKLVTMSTAFTFCGFPCHFLATSYDRTISNFNLTKDKFGFSDEYADITKLYTYPYSCLEVNDFKGNTTILKIEDTVGTLETHTIMCDMYPFLNVEAYLLGHGGTTRSTVTFKNNYESTFNIGGRYYDFSTKWSIPVFSVQLESNVGNEQSGGFIDNDWELNGKIGADVIYDNTSRSSLVNKGCINDNNSAVRYNFYEAQKWASSKLSLSNTFMDETLQLSIGKQDMKDLDIDNTGGPYGWGNKLGLDYYCDSELSAKTTAISANNATQSSINNAVIGAAVTGISVAAAVASSGLSVAAGVASAGATGTRAAAAAAAAIPAQQAALQVGAAATLVSTGLSATSESANYALALSADYEAMSKTLDVAKKKTFNTMKHAYYSNELQKQFNKDVLSGETGLYGETEGLTERQTIKNINTSDDNALNVYNAEIKNAKNVYNSNRNQIRLSNHPEYGQLTGTPDIISKPFGLTFNIVTQSKNAIRQAAEQFMRYGYMLNMQWKVNTFNLMKHFTYWKCSNIYCTGYEKEHNVYEGAQNVLKSILENGVTVWRNPEEIGNISIYQNGIYNG